MQPRSIQAFLTDTAQKDTATGPFELENNRLLEVKLTGRVWAKVGSMVAYIGAVKFTREGLLERGMGTLLKKAVSGEGAQLMKMEGQGRVYLADQGKRVQLLALGDETIVVNGNDLLTLEDRVQWSITMMRSLGGMLAAGLFNVRVTGPGLVAITTHHQPLTLAVRVKYPVYTDPNATVAWSGDLEPTVATDVSLGTLLGRGSGESVQLKFSGTGWVVVQPNEERTFQRR